MQPVKVFLELGTTGSVSWKHDIVFVEALSGEDSFESWIQLPPDAEEPDHKALQVLNTTTSQLHAIPEVSSDVMARWHEWLNSLRQPNQKVQLYSWIAALVNSFLRRWYEREGLEFPRSYMVPHVDVSSLAADALTPRRYLIPRFTRQGVADHFGLAPTPSRVAQTRAIYENLATVADNNKQQNTENT